MPRYIMALDQGTTSTRCILFDRAGQPVAMDQREHRQFFPAPGWVEHDPLEIWAATRAVMAGALTRARVGPADVAAVGIANQRETVVIWERDTGNPIHPALVWQDTRTAALCRRLAEAAGQDRFRAGTGLPIATYFSGPKLQWLLDHVPAARTRAERGELLAGTIDSWLIWNLTGGIHVTDPTNASRTLLMNLATLDWDPALLAAMAIPRPLLPEIRSSAEVFGTLRDLAPGVPVAACLGDQQAALFGQACFAPGEAKNTYGTGCFLLLNTGPTPVASKQGLLTTVACKLPGEAPTYALEGSVAVAGALIQWLRDNLGLIDSAAAVEEWAQTVADTGGCYIVPAFSGLFAPYWRSDARGVIVGLTRQIHKAHIARAALEATAYQTRDVLAAMTAETGLELDRLRVDGGMVGNEVLMQFQADILDRTVVRPACAETTALGAAFAAGLAVGFWQDREELRALWREARRWCPRLAAADRERLYQGWLKAVSRSFDWAE